MLRSLLQLGARSYLNVGKPLEAKKAAGSFVRYFVSFKFDGEAPRAGTMADVRKVLNSRLGLEEGYNPLPKSREHLLKYQPTAESLPPRHVRDSLSSAIIPLSTDAKLQDSYTAVLGNVRLGRLMEDMDAFAVWTCHQHLKVPTLPEDVHLPYTFVTILVDKISFSDLRTKSNMDIRITGHVSSVGKSSIECTVWLEQKENNVYHPITHAIFLMAARNATNTGAAPVNQLEPADAEEKRIIDEGTERRKLRKMQQDISVFNVEPNDYEQSIMYNIFKRTTHLDSMELNKRLLPPNTRWMSDSVVVNTMASFPENRNAHNTVFGGFLMRQSVEISWVAAWMYAKARPALKEIVDISFRRPVSVSSIIKLSSYVVFTKVNYMELMVVADVIDATSGTQFTSNVFYMTYETPDVVPGVLPRTYHEAMWYIQGRRKFKYAMGLE